MKTLTKLTESPWIESDVESTPLSTSAGQVVTGNEVHAGKGQKLRAKQPAPQVPVASVKVKPKAGQKPSAKPASSARAKALETITCTGKNPRSKQSEEDSSLSLNPQSTNVTIRAGSSVAARPPAVNQTRNATATSSVANRPHAGQRSTTGNGNATDPRQQSETLSSSLPNTSSGEDPRQQSASERPRLTAAEVAADRAKCIKDRVFAAQMATAIQVHSSFDSAAFQLYLKQTFAEAGNPTDPVERILLEQIVMAHFRIGDLAVLASGARQNEPIKILNSATARLTGELRKLAVALSTYRGNRVKSRSKLEQRRKQTKSRSNLKKPMAA